MTSSTPTVSDSPAPAAEQGLEPVSRPLDASNSEAAAASEPSFRWRVMQRVDDPNPARAAAQAAEDLRNGATGLSLVFAGAPNAFGFGLPSNLEGLRAALADVPLQGVHLRVDAHPQSRSSIDWLAQLFQEKQVNPTGVHLSFGVDPASLFVGTGQMRMSLEALEASLPQSLGGFFALSLPGVLLEADGRVYHNAGASETQELGIMLASASSYLRMFEEARQPPVYAIPHLGFATSVDQDLLTSTAKMRAIRILWTRMLRDYGIEPTLVPIHAETSFRMLSARDVETNIVRTTMAAFAASVGGADSISVLPHTIPLALPESDARRVALNTNLVQGFETSAQELISAQSDFVDSLVGRYCDEGWAEYKRIEAEGGVLRSIASGTLQARIAEERKEQLKRRGTLVGSTIYPKAAEPENLPEILQQIFTDAAITCEPLLPQRFEALAADAD